VEGLYRLTSSLFVFATGKSPLFKPSSGTNRKVDSRRHSHNLSTQIVTIANLTPILISTAFARRVAWLCGHTAPAPALGDTDCFKKFHGRSKISFIQQLDSNNQEPSPVHQTHFFIKPGNSASPLDSLALSALQTRPESFPYC